MLAKEWQAAQPCPGKNFASSKDYIAPVQATHTHQVPQVPPNALVCFSDAAWISSSGDMCFTDSKCLVGLFTGDSPVFAVKGIIHDISVLSNSLNSISFQFTSRACNQLADRIAKDALFLLSNSPLGMRNSVLIV
ncbi:hypothetical protein YC2023_080497 [Brassica napus]